MSGDRKPPETRGRRGARHGLVRGLAFTAVFFLILLEIAARGFWSYWLDVPFFRAGELRTAMHFAYYPNLKPVYEAEIRDGDGTFDVLLLGGSVINEWYGDIELRLAADLRSRVDGPVRIHNVSFPGHMTRDSYAKYALLGHQRFDLVVVYHGINDVVANNVSRADYRADYSHLLWIDGYQRLTRHPSITLPILAAPYTTRFGIAKIKERLPIAGAIRRNDPEFRQRHRLGADLKTPPSFRDNLDSIAALASRRGDPLVLMTFAWYVPEDYTLEKFEAKALDYAEHRSAIEIWGEPANVKRTLEAHNDMVVEVAEKHHTLFVDQRASIPDGRIYHNDVAHLAPSGCQAWVNNLMDVLDPWLATVGVGPSPRLEGRGSQGGLIAVFTYSAAARWVANHTPGFDRM